MELVVEVVPPPAGAAVPVGVVGLVDVVEVRDGVGLVVVFDVVVGVGLGAVVVVVVTCGVDVLGTGVVVDDVPVGVPVVEVELGGLVSRPLLWSAVWISC